MGTAITLDKVELGQRGGIGARDPLRAASVSARRRAARIGSKILHAGESDFDIGEQ